MNTETTDTRVRQIAPVADLRQHSTLDRFDYEDAFVVDIGSAQARTAVEWMRVILEEAPTRIRMQLLSGWTGLGLKLSLPGSAGAVLGWKVRSEDDDLVLLGADSRIGMPAELVLRRDGQELLFATLVRQDNPVARAMWASIEATHVRTVRTILELASRRVVG